MPQGGLTPIKGPLARQRAHPRAPPRSDRRRLGAPLRLGLLRLAGQLRLADLRHELGDALALGAIPEIVTMAGLVIGEIVVDVRAGKARGKTTSKSGWSRSTAAPRWSRAAGASASAPWLFLGIEIAPSALALERPTRCPHPSKRPSRTRRRTL